MLRDERVVPDRRHDEPVPEAFRILEDQAVFVARQRCRVGREPALPEVEGGVRAHAPLDRVHHAGSGAAATSPGVLEERDVASGRPVLVGVEEVVDGRVVLVHGLLHEPKSEHAGVEVDVPRERRP